LDALCSDLQSGIAKLRRQEMAFARVGREHGEAQRGIVDAAERGVLDRSSSFPRAFESAPPATQPVAERPAPPAFRAAFESAPPATKPAAERPIAPAARRPPFESAPPETQLAGPSITDEAALRRRIAELEHELESTRERLHGTIAELRRHNEQLEAANQALAADGRRIRERLDLAVAFARLSFWDWDVTAGVIASVPDARSQNGAEEAPGPMRLEEWEARVHPDDRSLLRASYAACLTDGADSWSCEVRVRMPDESFRWVHQGGRVVERDANGLPRRILGTTQDVHARRTIENLVRRDAELLSKLQDSIFCTDPDGTITYWNDGAARLYGWSALEALGRTLAERVGRGAACDVSERLRAVLGGSDYQDEWEDVRKDGSRVWVDVRLTRFDDADGRPAGVIGISRDVTERKLLEATMRRDARILAELHDAVICGDATGNVVYLNAAAERIFGWNRAELLGRRVHEPLPAASAVLVERLTRRALAGEATESVDFEHRRADGSGVWIAYRAYPLLDAAGKVTGTVALATDVTERRRAEAERRQLEQQLLHAQKMEIIGTLAGGIAHDFNNILTAILMYAELCLLEAQQATSLSEGLNEIKAACLRAKDLVQRILTFSRFQEPEPKPVDLRLVVKDACKLLRVMLPATLDIRVDLPERPTSALADANQIHQVLLNLGSNAAHAMQNTGELTISVRAIGLDAPLPVRGGVLLPRRYVRIAVIDRGHGMSDETLARIFDPFFTTKRPGEGTGLGLPIVRGIVQNHGGGITVESVPGEGSVFTVYLPAALTPSTQMAAVQAGQATPRGRGERILVVDDEESVAILTKTALDSLGYRATHVTSVEDFLRAFEASPSSYRLILTDQTMPRLSGLDLARRVRAAGHTIPIIIATGFSRKLTPEAVATIGHAARLSKPFELHELAVLVHDLLERRAE
ncbi:MAG: PAS domain-containing protein, partial [Pseudomonadota bacterium]